MIKSRASCVSIAPMMGWTNEHFRAFIRLISIDYKLYTEMVVADKMKKHVQLRALKFTANQHPIVLQLGGSDPDVLAECAEKAWQLGFDEINLNVGCPSKKVRTGQMGAILMKSPDLVAKCLKAMKCASPLPVSIKTRIGVDDSDNISFLNDFIAQVSEESGCKYWVIHARKAYLQGLSAKENRNIPPLDYDRVITMKEKFSHLHWVINGGIRSVESAVDFLKIFDGVMLGRIAYENPWVLIKLQEKLSGEKAISINHMLEAFFHYAQAEIMEKKITPSYVFKPFLRLYTQHESGKTWHEFVNKILIGKEDEMIKTLCGFIEREESMIA